MTAGSSYYNRSPRPTAVLCNSAPPEKQRPALGGGGRRLAVQQAHPPDSPPARRPQMQPMVAAGLAAFCGVCVAYGWMWPVYAAAALVLITAYCCRDFAGPSEHARVATVKEWQPLDSRVAFAVVGGRPIITGLLPYDVPVRLECDYTAAGARRQWRSRLRLVEGAAAGAAVLFTDGAVEVTLEVPEPDAGRFPGAQQIELVLSVRSCGGKDDSGLLTVHNVRVDLEMAGPAFRHLEAVQMLRHGFSTFTKSSALAGNNQRPFGPPQPTMSRRRESHCRFLLHRRIRSAERSSRVVSSSFFSLSASLADEVGLGYLFPFIPRRLAGVVRNIDSRFFGTLEVTSVVLRHSIVLSISMSAVECTRIWI